MDNYLIIDKDEPEKHAIIKAENEKEALSEWYDSHYDNEIFTENFECSGDGFWDNFLFDDKGYFWNEDDGNQREDLKGREDYKAECYKKNIKEFFKDKPEFYEQFTELFDNDKELKFSEEFYKYCYLNSSWINDLIIEKVEIT